MEDFDMDHPEVQEIGSTIRGFVHVLAKFIGWKDSLFENSVIPCHFF